MADFRPWPFTLPDCPPSLQQSQWIDVAGADLCSLGGACCCALGFNAAEVKIRNDALTWLSDDFCRTTVQYGHVEEGRDAIASGFVYRGKIAPLRGKYIFGDITTGHIRRADFKGMIAVDDGNPKTMAAIHPMGLLWQTLGGKEELHPSERRIVSDSKSDGMIREAVAAVERQRVGHLPLLHETIPKEVVSTRFRTQRLSDLFYARLTGAAIIISVCPHAGQGSMR